MENDNNGLPGLWSWSPACADRSLCAQVWDSDDNNVVALDSSDDGSAAVSTIVDRHNQDVAALQAEIGRLRVAIRVNALRAGATDAEIDEVIGTAEARRQTRPNVERGS